MRKTLRIADVSPRNNNRAPENHTQQLKKRQPSQTVVITSFSPTFSSRVDAIIACPGVRHNLRVQCGRWNDRPFPDGFPYFSAWHVRGFFLCRHHQGLHIGERFTMRTRKNNTVHGASRDVLIAHKAYRALSNVSVVQSIVSPGS